MGEALAVRLSGFALVEVDRVRVVGRERPETVHALLGDEAAAGKPAFRDFAQAHAAMLDAYRARRWDDAEERLSVQAENAARYGPAALYERYRAAIAAWRAAPPPPGKASPASAKSDGAARAGRSHILGFSRPALLDSAELPFYPSEGW